MKLYLLFSTITLMGSSAAFAAGAVHCSFTHEEEDKRAELVTLGEAGLLKLRGQEGDRRTTNVLICNESSQNQTCIYFWTNPMSGAVVHNVFAITEDLKSVVVSRSGPNAPDQAFVSIYPAECRRN